MLAFILIWIQQLTTGFRKPDFRKMESGQGLVEYALLLIFVSVVMVALMTILGPAIANVYENLVLTFNNVGG